MSLNRRYIRKNYFIQSFQVPGQTLCLRHTEPMRKPKKSPSHTKECNTKAVLCVHGAVTHSVIFDAENASWLDAFAKEGYEAFALDLQGYGRSFKPKAMDLPCDYSHTPLVCTHSDALQDISCAVHHIKKHFNIEQVVLVGLSWGGVLSASYASRCPQDISKLVLFAPIYSYKNSLWHMFTDPTDETRLNAHIGGYRVINENMLFAGWDAELALCKDARIRDDATFQHIKKDVLMCDETWAKAHNISAVRSPCGVLKDVVDVYNQTPLFEAQNIQAPLLILRGDKDTICLHADMQNLFEAVKSPKIYVQVGDATHYALVEHAFRNMTEYVMTFLKLH